MLVLSLLPLLTFCELLATAAAAAAPPLGVEVVLTLFRVRFTWFPPTEYDNPEVLFRFRLGLPDDDVPLFAPVDAVNKIELIKIKNNSNI